MRRSSCVAASILLVSLVAGCGDSESTDDSDKPASTPAASTPAASAAISVHMTEFAFDPQDATAKAGKVTISAPNDGKVVHELVVLRTDADPAKLPMEGNEVDESTSVGEIPDVEAGATKSVTLDLKPGKYVMVCALPGHYQSGMHGSLTVE